MGATQPFMAVVIQVQVHVCVCVSWYPPNPRAKSDLKDYVVV